jgi:hypothetical protein
MQQKTRHHTKEEIVMVETPQEENETFDSVDEMFKRIDEELAERDRKNPIRTHIRDWLDDRFPNGIADYRAYYALTHPWEILRHWKYLIKYAYQRVYRGWDDRAMWGIDMYLSKMIPEMTTELIKWSEGLPMSVFEGLPYEDEENYNYSEESMKIASERWNKILEEIAEGFAIYYETGGDMQYYKDEENLRKTEKFEKAFDLFRKNFGSLGD